MKAFFALALLLLAAHPACAAQAVATFAGGCFWCMEPPFESLTGVISVTAGYTGGTKPDPGYEEVSAGGTGHAEAVQIVYDPTKLSFEKLLEVFWRNIDPTVADRQFCDVGSQYRSAIFVHDAAQRKAAEVSLADVRRRLGKPVKTQIAQAGPFYSAEDYHQDYYRTDPLSLLPLRLRPRRTPARDLGPVTAADTSEGSRDRIGQGARRSPRRGTMAVDDRGGMPCRSRLSGSWSQRAAVLWS